MNKLKKGCYNCKNGIIDLALSTDLLYCKIHKANFLAASYCSEWENIKAELKNNNGRAQFGQIRSPCCNATLCAEGNNAIRVWCRKCGKVTHLLHLGTLIAFWDGNLEAVKKEKHIPQWAIELKKPNREIYSAIQHYWRKGYIPNRQLFDYLKIYLQGKDPFQIEIVLRFFARQVIIKREALIANLDTNGFINGFTIDSERFNKIYTEEYQKLKSYIGKEKRKPCQCGRKGTFKGVLFDMEEREKAKGCWNKHLLRLGNIYWKGGCDKCKPGYEDILEESFMDYYGRFIEA